MAMITYPPQKVTPENTRPHAGSRRVNWLTVTQLVTHITPPNQDIYEKNKSWFLSQKEYLAQTQKDLTRIQSWEQPDTYRNLNLTETRLESQLKFMALWFNEIWRWFPIKQYESQIRGIVVDTINRYIEKVPLPHYTLEEGLVTPFYEIEIIVGAIQVEFKESHHY